MACEGCGTSGCCCAPVSQFANTRVSGLHPETVVHQTFALTASEPSADGPWGIRYQLVPESVHLVGLSFFADPNNVATSTDLKGIAVTLYATEDPDTDAEDVVKFIVTLKPGESYTFGDEILGCWFDFGIYAQVVGNSAAIGSGTSDDKVVLNISHVERINYSPAYTEPIAQARHYWQCNREDNFLSNWYPGTGSDMWDGSGDASTPDTTVTSLVPHGGGSLWGDKWILDQQGDPIQTEEDDLLIID
jgi:hypothetical protein